MGQNTAPERPVLVPGETRLFSVSYDRVLDSGESLTGVPTVTEVTTTDLTVANESVSVAVLKIRGRNVPAGRALQFKASGQIVAHSPYTIKIVCGTDCAPAQTLVRYVAFKVEDE